MNNQALPRSHSFYYNSYSSPSNLLSRICRNWGLMWKILCAESAGRQLKLRNTSSSIVLPCAEEEARIWKLSRRREDRGCTISLKAERQLLGKLNPNPIRGKKSNLLTLYKAQIRPSLEYCSHIWGAAAPTTSSILDAVQRRAIRPIGDPALTCHLQLHSHRLLLVTSHSFTGIQTDSAPPS
nr:unnamed protein product [Callosobruchus chinensis]